MKRDRRLRPLPGARTAHRDAGLRRALQRMIRASFAAAASGQQLADAFRRGI